MRTIRRGNRGPEAGLLRRLLNRKLNPSPGLPEARVFGARYNGAFRRIDFGPRTEAAVRRFQESKRIAVDGIVGPVTWRELGITTDVERNVQLAGQPSSDTCYAAAATMLLGPGAAMSFDPGPVPAGTRPDDHWARSFADQFLGWTLQYGVSPLPAMLANFLRRGTFWFAGNLPFPSGHSYHAAVVSAVWGDGDPFRTMVRIHDPWPPNRGEVYGIILGDYVRQSPQAFRYIIHR